MNRYLVKHIIYPIHEWIKTNNTLNILKELEKSQKLDRSTIENIQLKKLKRLVHHAYHTVPYYRRLFDIQGIKPDDIQTLMDYSHVPLLTREIIRSKFAELISTAYKGKRIPYTTGGSTGEPLKFYVDNLRISNEWAANWRARRWWGVDIGDRMVNIWASPIEISANSKIKEIRDRLLNYKLISALDLRPEEIPNYLQLIRKHNADYLFGYSSSIYFVAKLVEEQNLSVPKKLKAIFTTADTLFDQQRRLIEKVFNAPVGLEYGARDGGFIAHECPQGGLHIFEEGVLVEIVDQQDHLVHEGQEGEIVLTILDSRVMPFLRYKIDDVGQLSTDECPCGVKLKVMAKLIGRKCDNLLRSDNSTIHGPALANILITDPNIEKYQIIQSDYHKLCVKMVTSRNISEKELNKINCGIEKVFGEPVDVSFERVEEIAVTTSGKTRYIINEIA